MPRPKAPAAGAAAASGVAWVAAGDGVGGSRTVAACLDALLVVAPGATGSWDHQASMAAPLSAAARCCRCGLRRTGHADAVASVRNLLMAAGTAALLVQATASLVTWAAAARVAAPPARWLGHFPTTAGTAQPHGAALQQAEAWMRCRRVGRGDGRLHEPSAGSRGAWGTGTGGGGVLHAGSTDAGDGTRQHGWRSLTSTHPPARPPPLPCRAYCCVTHYTLACMQRAAQPPPHTYTSTNTNT